MYDSLLSRFRGAFLGTLLGEAIGISLQSQPGSAWHCIQGQRIQGQFDHSLGAVQSNSLGKLMLAEAAALVRYEGGQTGADQTNLDQINAVQTRADTTGAKQFIHLPVEGSGTAVLLTTLPLALFYHDQPLLCQTALSEATSQCLEADSLAVAVVGQTVSLILRERFVAPELIPQILKDLNLAEVHPLSNHLMQVQNWLEQPSTLNRVSDQLKRLSVSSPPTWIALAGMLYSFLSTPDNSRLSILRSAQLSPVTSALITSALTGAISGLYNGLAGLPMGWRQQLKSSDAFEPVQPWETAAKAEQLADRLLALWSGASQPDAWLEQPQFSRITAAPRTIRPD